jgi:hypothetical protein
MSQKYLSSLLLSFVIALICLAYEDTQAIPNPAAVHCINQGGHLKILKRGDGGEYGICDFQNGKQCEEWAMFPGE